MLRYILQRCLYDIYLIVIGVIVSVSADQYCFKAFSCIGQTLDNRNTSWIYGYKAAYGPSTTASGGKIHCRGALSCHSMSSIMVDSDRIDCEGSNSCSNTIIQTAHDTIACSGPKSCRNSDITTVGSGELYCHYQSCAHSYIHGIQRIYAVGQFALFNATIDSNEIDISSLNHLNVYLSGSYAGLGTKLLCRENHICTVHCNAFNACFMFFMECIGTCYVSKRSASYISPTNNLTEFNTMNIELSNYRLFDSETVDVTLDELCLDDMWSFDDVDERKNAPNLTVDTENTIAICCRGAHSCNAINEITLKSSTKQYLICSGYYACSFSTIKSNNNSVFCASTVGCGSSSIVGAHHIYCSGGWSCQYTKIFEANYVLCRAAFSCEHTEFTTNGTGSHLSIYFTGYYSGNFAILDCNVTDVCNVYCIGLSSCLDATVFCNGDCNVECDVNTKCPMVIRITKEPTHTYNRSNQESTIADLYSSWTQEPTQYRYPSSDSNEQSLFMLWSVISCSCFCCCCVILMILYRMRMNSKSAETDQEMMEIEQTTQQPDGELVRWLTSTVGLEQYLMLFLHNGYESLEFISKIKEESQLVAIGITLQGHRTQIMSEIEVLREERIQPKVVTRESESEDSERCHTTRNSESESDHANDDLWEEHHTQGEGEGEGAVTGCS